MNEIDFLQQQIAVMQRRLAELKQSSREYLLVKPESHYDYIIEFDGGTSCNDPAKGYGDGYGTFMVGEKGTVFSSANPKFTRRFGIGHSWNSAEIYTLVEALLHLHKELDRPKEASVLCRGDSRIALKWVNCKKHPPEKTSPKFRDGIRDLRSIVSEFGCVRTEWRGREHSVKLFGH